MRKTARIIIAEVCQKWGLTKGDMLSKGRTHHLVLSRSELCYRLRHETDLVYASIGRHLNTDHSSAMYAAKKWPMYQEKYKDLIARVTVENADVVTIMMTDEEERAERTRKHHEHCKHVASQTRTKKEKAAQERRLESVRKPKPDTSTVKERKCLGGCDQMFLSDNPGNRVCYICKSGEVWRSGDNCSEYYVDGGV